MRKVYGVLAILLLNGVDAAHTDAQRHSGSGLLKADSLEDGQDRRLSLWSAVGASRGSSHSRPESRRLSSRRSSFSDLGSDSGISFGLDADVFAYMRQVTDAIHKDEGDRVTQIGVEMIEHACVVERRKSAVLREIMMLTEHLDQVEGADKIKVSSDLMVLQEFVNRLETYIQAYYAYQARVESALRSKPSIIPGIALQTPGLSLRSLSDSGPKKSSCTRSAKPVASKKTEETQLRLPPIAGAKPVTEAEAKTARGTSSTKYNFQQHRAHHHNKWR